MSLQTDLNIDPFFDDFDEDKQYHRVLFRPSFPVQARELTQLQTILQNQIERFGDNIFVEGTIIKGCNFNFLTNYNYVKIADLTVEGLDVDMDSYVDIFAIDESIDLRAITIETVPGLESDEDGNLNTIYLRYLNAGANGEIQFSNGAILTLFTKNFALQRIDVLDGGTGYTNSEAIIVTGGGGSGANGFVITFSNSTISQVVLTSGGTEYTTAPNVSVSSTGTGAIFSARHFIDKVAVANSSFTAPVGSGYAFKVTDGVVFQKGHFIKVNEQSVIVEKYSRTPNNVVVGFNTLESIVNNSIDTTLNDNAAGFTNFKAPGAFRLKLEPELVVLDKSVAAANDTFFSLVEFQNGLAVKENRTAKYNEIGRELAKRTNEESGSYVVNKFKLTTESITANGTHLNAFVGAGIAYVDGYRVQFTNPVRFPFDVPTETATAATQSVSLSFGNYVLVKELMGVFPVNTITQVSLRDSPQGDLTEFGEAGTDTTPNSNGAIIGTAFVGGFQVEDGLQGSPDTTYRMYLFGIKMNSGHTFQNVKGITTATAACDVILTNGIATLFENAFATRVFATGLFSLESYAAGTTYTFRRTRAATFASNGSVQVTLSGSEEFPYGVGPLTATQIRDFTVVPTATQRSANLAGTVSSTGSDDIITGTGTAFLSDFSVGEYIMVDVGASQHQARVIAIANNTQLRTSWNVPAEASVVYAKVYPQNIALNGTLTITIDGAQTLTLDLDQTLNGTMDVTLYYNGREDNWFSTKAVTKNAITRISNNALASVTTNRWSLGHADVFKLQAVYKTSNNSVWDEAVDVTQHFLLDTGQKDSYYGLSHLVKKPSSTLSLDGTTNLIARYDVFTVSSKKGYFTLESYPLSNTVPVESNKVNWIEIPTFSSLNGRIYDLRDSVDVRDSVVNTAVLENTTITSATIDPTATETFSGTVYQPSPNQVFTADIDYFLPRVDRVTIDTLGFVSVNKGTASLRPRPPELSAGTMTLGYISIPPFPAIATNDRNLVSRGDHTVQITTEQHRRYTMKDLEDLERRVKQIEYYTSLNSLETDTRNQVIPSEANVAIGRFKNGFIVDPFTDYKIAATSNPELLISIDTGQAVATPMFEQAKFDLVPNTFSGTVKKGKNIYLSYEDAPLIVQDVANRFRTITQSFWNFAGTMSLTPSYDNFVSTAINPVAIDLNFDQYLAPLVDATNDAFRQIKINESTSLDSRTFQTGSTSWDNGQRWWSTSFQGGDWITSQLGGVTVRNNFATIDTETARWDYLQLTPGQLQVQSQQVGDFVTNFAMSPFMRGTKVVFFARGLRPGTRHFAFFDRVAVDQHCIPMSHLSGSQSNDPADYFEVGQRGDPLVADINGIVVGAFYLPDGEFLVGEREFRLTNVSDIASWNTEISFALSRYSAYNFDQSKSRVTLNTSGTVTDGAHVVNEQVITTERRDWTQTSRTSQVIQSFRPQWSGWGSGSGDGNGGGGGGDPLSQSFLVDTNLCEGAEGIHLTKLDLYFRNKDSTFGITVQIRSVQLGIPTRTVLTGARLTSSDVSTSNDASVATTVIFDTPIFLRADEEYCVCLIPEANSPEYEVWTGSIEVTEGDLSTGIIKNGDWSKGAMFLSTNASTWTPIQGEDIKFTAYFARFLVNQGTTTFVNDDREFLTLASSSGNIKTGDRVALYSNGYTSGWFNSAVTTNEINTTNTAVVSQVVVGSKLLIVFDGSANTANAAGTVSVNATSNVVTGSGTSFDSLFIVNDSIFVNMDGDANTQVRRITGITNSTSVVVDKPFSSIQSGVGYHRITPVYDVVDVRGVTTNATHTILALNKTARSTTNTTNHSYAILTIGGNVDEVDVSIANVAVANSTANSTVYFDSNSYFVTSDGNNQVTASVSTVNDPQISHFEALVDKIITPGTSLTVSANVMNSSNTTISTEAAFGVTNFLTFQGKVRSKSNEMRVASGTKSYSLTASFNNGGMRYNTPVVGAAPASILRYSWIINNDESEEHTAYGAASAKYVTKQIALADGQEAEDIRIFVTAYKPLGTEVTVYAKILNETDSAPIVEKDWSELQQITDTSVHSSSSNRNDFREYEYTFHNRPIGEEVFVGGAPIRGSITDANTIIITTGDASANIVVNDVITIIDSSGEYNVRTVASSNSTAIVVTVATNLATGTETGLVIERATRPETAFKNYDWTGSTTGDGIVRYFDSSRSAYDTYKYLAIKVVLTSNSYAIVPRLDDMRAIATSV